MHLKVDIYHINITITLLLHNITITLYYYYITLLLHYITITLHYYNITLLLQWQQAAASNVLHLFAGIKVFSMVAICAAR